MLLVDRLILRIWLTYFLSGNVVAGFLAYILDILEKFDAQKGVLEGLLSSLSVLPVAFNIFSPYAVFIATLLTLINISKSNEIMVLKASGLSILRIIRPIIIFSFVVMGFFYINQSYLARWLNSPVSYNFFDNTPTGWYYSQNRLINIKEPSILLGKVESVTVINFDLNQKLVSYSVFSDLTKQDSYWQAKNADFLVSVGKDVSKHSTKDYLITGLNIEELFKSPANPTINQSFYDLYQSWQNTQLGQRVSDRSFLLILDKISYLLAFLNLVLAALAFSNINVRSGKMFIHLAKATFVYYIYGFLDQSLLFLAKDQVIGSFLGAFGANIFLSVFFIWFLNDSRIINLNYITKNMIAAIKLGTKAAKKR